MRCPCCRPAQRAIGLLKPKITVANSSSHGTSSENVRLGVTSSSTAPMTAPITLMTENATAMRTGSRLSSVFAAQTDAADPGQMPIVLVMFAASSVSPPRPRQRGEREERPAAGDGVGHAGEERHERR